MRVEGAEVGSLFRYDLKDKVTVPDRSSTLVAIGNKRVSGKEVVLFRLHPREGTDDDLLVGNLRRRGLH